MLMGSVARLTMTSDTKPQPFSHTTHIIAQRLQKDTQKYPLPFNLLNYQYLVVCMQQNATRLLATLVSSSARQHQAIKSSSISELPCGGNTKSVVKSTLSAAPESFCNPSYSQLLSLHKAERDYKIFKTH
jgi:hypothetical protein